MAAKASCREARRRSRRSRFYSGIVTVGADGTAEVNFDIPAFTGTVRVMAVAWSKDKIGHASGDVVVRDPVVVTATLPRFLLMGDKSTLRLDLDNVEGATGNYKIAVTTDGPLSVERRRQDACARRQEARRRSAADLGDRRRCGTGRGHCHWPRGLYARRANTRSRCSRRRRSSRAAR